MAPPSPAAGSPDRTADLRLPALAFAALALASLGEVFAPPTQAVTLVAATVLAWGLSGLGLSGLMRGFPEGRLGALAFAVLALLGLLFLLRPAAGIEEVALAVVAGFLAGGLVSVLLGLRLSTVTARWRWMVASGAVSLLLGFVLLLIWPDTTLRVLGLAFDLNFLVAGLALFVLGRVAGGRA